MEEPLVQAHLRVCWENLKAAGNCSSCEKCCRTMLTLAQHGMLRQFRVFEPARLVNAVGELPPLHPDIWVVYRKTLSGLSPELADAVRRLLVRSEQAARWKAWRKRLMIFGKSSRHPHPG